MTLKPEVVKYLKDAKLAALPAVWEVPVAQLRELSQLRYSISGDVTPIHSIEDRYIPGPTSDLHIRIYRPTNEDNLPATVYFHGGGWVLGFIDLYDPCLTALAKSTNSVVIAVNYQKAPEHPFPIPLDDCYATLAWVVRNAKAFNINPDSVGVAGDSAGGNLAAAVALRARDEKLVALKFQLLVYPCIDANFSTYGYTELAEGYGLTTKIMQWFWDQYLGDSKNATNPYACPSRAESFADLAPAIIITAQYDPLVTDSVNYAEQLRTAGNPVIYREFEGVIHGFFGNMVMTPISAQAVDFAGVEIKKATR